MTVSIEELARMANTSASTVSRALSGKPGVGEAKRENIRMLAEKVDYRPNQFARNLRSKKSHTLGFVTENLTNPTHAEFLRTMEMSAREAGYHILVADSRGALEDERDNIEALMRNRVDGFVLFPVNYENPSENTSHLQVLHSQRVPFVIGAENPYSYFDTVVSDDFEAGKRLARRLIELGHRRFGVVGGGDRSLAAGNRCDGIVEALREAQLLGPDEAPEPPVVRALEGVPENRDALRRLLHNWFAEEQTPTALVCVNSPTALRLIRPLRDAGLRVPEDVSLASFDDQIWCGFIETSLTTMSPRVDKVARLLFETLMARIENPQAPPVRHCVPQEFYERESTGPAPSTGQTAVG